MKLQTEGQMIHDLMGDDSKVDFAVAHVGHCPSCNQRRTLYRITIGKEVIYVCFDCLRTALHIISIKERENGRNTG
jgi:hypothetical protein